MTRYNGERLMICHTAIKDGAALVPADVDGVFVTVLTKDWTIEELEEVPMTWNAAKARWEYPWVTADVDAGVYNVKVRILGVDGGSDWEYTKVRIKADPVLA